MKRRWLRYGSYNWLSKEISNKFMLGSLVVEDIKDFTKATYLALANVMKLLKVE
jgi:hypothetical protein